MSERRKCHNLWSIHPIPGATSIWDGTFLYPLPNRESLQIRVRQSTVDFPNSANGHRLGGWWIAPTVIVSEEKQMERARVASQTMFGFIDHFPIQTQRVCNLFCWDTLSPPTIPTSAGRDQNCQKTLDFSWRLEIWLAELKSTTCPDSRLQSSNTSAVSPRLDQVWNPFNRRLLKLLYCPTGHLAPFLNQVHRPFIALRTLFLPFGKWCKSNKNGFLEVLRGPGEVERILHFVERGRNQHHPVVINLYILCF